MRALFWNSTRSTATADGPVLRDERAQLVGERERAGRAAASVGRGADHAARDRPHRAALAGDDAVAAPREPGVDAEHGPGRIEHRFDPRQVPVPDRAICAGVHAGRSILGRWRSTAVARPGPPAGANAGWSGSRTISATRQWAAVKAAWGGCAYCGATGTPLQRDCVLALSRGGRYTLDNIVPACGSCNTSKCNDEVTGWLRRKRLDERAFLLRHRTINTALVLEFPTAEAA